MNADTVNRILGITESYKMPEVLSGHLFNCHKREKLFDEFMAEGESLDHDWFTEYFQTEHGDRKKLKQDYTPDCVCSIACHVSGISGTVGDVCSGTGGLALKAWQMGAKEFYCVEFSERVVPVLLMNLSIRNIKAIVVHGDALEKKTFAAYKLAPDSKYSDIEIIEDTDGIQDIKVDTIIMNPPYSMKWSGDRVFSGYETPPKSKCDYAFVLDGMERLKDGGTLTTILPHGVLFRGSREGKVREALCNEKALDTIIGMPDKLFLNTDIPVTIIKWRKGSPVENTLFIDADKQCKKDGKKNVMEQKHIEKVLSALNLRTNIDKFSYVTDLNEISKNDYNLNIPRYVDTYEPPPPIDIVKVTKELYETEKQIRSLNHDIRIQVDKLTTNEEKRKEELNAVQNYWRKIDEAGELFI